MNKLLTSDNITILNQHATFDGILLQCEHYSESTNSMMRFAIFLPPRTINHLNVKSPVMYWLSGLTCTDENFMQKAGALRVAAELGIAIVAPDTSPRGESVPDAEAYDFGQGAGFYLNATESPYKQHYQMYDYVVNELPELIQSNFSVNDEQCISGHSMGGHGALMIALKNSERYTSASAFSPITNPMNCPWGQKAFSGYLGTDKTAWSQYDSTELLKSHEGRHIPMLVDQGGGDEFLNEQLKPQSLLEAARKKAYPLNYRLHARYDHSYYFIASFIDDHLLFHSQYLT